MGLASVLLIGYYLRRPAARELDLMKSVSEYVQHYKGKDYKGLMNLVEATLETVKTNKALNSPDLLSLEEKIRNYESLHAEYAPQDLIDQTGKELDEIIESHSKSRFFLFAGIFNAAGSLFLLMNPYTWGKEEEYRKKHYG